MKSIAAWFTLLLMIGVPRIGALAQNKPGPTAKDELIEEARRHAHVFVSELPNFVVDQKITCNVQSPLTQGK
jgi:hypothetical protein